MAVMGYGLWDLGYGIWELMMTRVSLIFFVLFLGCVIKGGEVMALELKSPAFKSGEFIPAKYTCKGEDVSPALEWTDVPEGTKAFALISDDPDAPMGTWVHWVLYEIPAGEKSLPEGVKNDKVLSDGSKQGMTDFGRVGYGGPCPPPGKPHRYFFKLYALDAKLDLKPGLTKKALLDAVKGHVIEEAELMGKFQR